MSDANKSSWPKWLRDDKSVVSCTEKVKVMTENFDEIKQIAQDALEDGLLMEVSETQMRSLARTGRWTDQSLPKQRFKIA